MEEYDGIFVYLQDQTYPDGLTKDGKQNWRRKCTENFKIENGQLYHRKSNRNSKAKEQDQQSGVDGNEWKRCIKSKEEKERILKSCHSSETGELARCTS